MSEITDQIAGVRDIQFVSLAPVANVHAALVLDRALPSFIPEICSGTAAQSGELGLQSING